MLTDFLIAGPERARVVDTFEKGLKDRDLGDGVGKHHDQSPAVQNCFMEQTTELHCEFARQGSHFEDTSNEIAHFNSKHVPSKDVHAVVMIDENKGKEQYVNKVSHLFLIPYSIRNK